MGMGRLGVCLKKKTVRLDWLEDRRWGWKVSIMAPWSTVTERL